MFYHYNIVHSNNEDILYLYVDIKYEFASDFNLENTGDLIKRCSNFIRTNNIKFKGNKVYLVVDGVIVKGLQISNNENNNIINSNNTDYSYDKFIINIKLNDNSMCEITLRDYIISVLLAKYIDSLSDEVYKSMAVLYNTYAYKMMNEKGYINSSNSFAIYKPINYYKGLFSNYEDIINRFNILLKDTECFYLSYKGNYILPFIHYSSNGKTLSNHNYDYLSSVNSLWDMLSPYYVNLNNFSYDELSNKLGESLNSHLKIQIIPKNNYKVILINGRLYQLEEFKTLLGLNSLDMYFIINKNSFQIITRGWGNFYGLSLFGANSIAENGALFQHILKYYFPKVQLLKYIKELS